MCVPRSPPAPRVTGAEHPGKRAPGCHTNSPVVAVPRWHWGLAALGYAPETHSPPDSTGSADTARAPAGHHPRTCPSVHPPGEGSAPWPLQGHLRLRPQSCRGHLQAGELAGKVQAGPMACGVLWCGPATAATWPHPVAAGRQRPGFLNSDPLCCTRTEVIADILFRGRVPVCPWGCHGPQQDLRAEVSVIRLLCCRCEYTPAPPLPRSSLPESRAAC